MAVKHAPIRPFEFDARRRRWAIATVGAGVLAALALWQWVVRPALAGSEISARRAQIAAMTDEQREHLWFCLRSFEAMSPEDQVALVDLNRQIEADPQSRALYAVADRYYEWLQDFYGVQRDRLRMQSLEERIQMIRAMQAGQAKLPNVVVDKRDAAKILAFMRQLVEKNEPQLREHLQRQKKGHEQYQSLREVDRPRWLLFWALNRWRNDGAGPLPDKVAIWLPELKKQLSPELRERLDGLPMNEQLRVVSGAALEAINEQVTHGRGRGGPADFITDEELMEFFEKELKPEDLDRLLTLNGPQMQRELLRLYFKYKGVPGIGPPFGGLGPRAGGPGPWMGGGRPGGPERPDAEQGVPSPGRNGGGRERPVEPAADAPASGARPAAKATAKTKGAGEMPSSALPAKTSDGDSSATESAGSENSGTASKAVPAKRGAAFKGDSLEHGRGTYSSFGAAAKEDSNAPAGDRPRVQRGEAKPRAGED